MKSFNILVVFLLAVFWGFAQESDTELVEVDGMASFGEKISSKNSTNSQEMTVQYQKLKVADTLQTKFTGVVNEVCQSKGCWMQIKLENGEQAMVKFKDYGFFVPKDIAGREVIINGKAFIEEMSVDEQRHYAEDAGKSKEEVAFITEPKKTYRFEADGVLIKK